MAPVVHQSRAHHYALLLLARYRLEDREQQPSLPEAGCGWRYQDVLVRQLGIDANLLHMHLHRARRQLCSAGLLDGGHIVERRPQAGQLRLGCPQAHIRRV